MEGDVRSQQDLEDEQRRARSTSVSIDSKFAQQQYKEGLDLCKQGDYKAALRHLKISAKEGHAGAMFTLGALYEKGEGLEQNSILAVNYFKKAAKLGDARAAFSLGMHYKNGDGVRANLRKCVKYLRKAGSKDHDKALYNLGVIFETEESVQNFTSALACFEKAAELGNVKAITNVGVMYEKGKGAAANYEKATEYYKMAAERGDSHSYFNLSNSFKYGRGVEKDEIAATELLTKAAQGNMTKAQYNLAMLWLKNPTTGNKKEAYTLLKKAAASGETKAMRHWALVRKQVKTSKGLDKHSEIRGTEPDLDDDEAVQNDPPLSQSAKAKANQSVHGLTEEKPRLVAPSSKCRERVAAAVARRNSKRLEQT